MSAGAPDIDRSAADHPNRGKCLAIRDADCALKGGVCRCLMGAPVPEWIEGTKVTGLRAR